METLNVKVEQAGTTLTVLEGQALSPRAPISLKLSGTIDSPGNFLEKRKSVLNLLNCNVIVNRDKMTIEVVSDETDPFKIAYVQGKLELHPGFVSFQINTGKTWSPFALADFIKMNRSFFSSKEVAADLVKSLRDFKAKVEKTIENFKDDKANFNIKKAQAVETNLPQSFTIVISIFKGQPIMSLPVEINIHPETLDCQLCSPDANDAVVSYRESAINEQVARIEILMPELLIIEQ
jgi:hypothetical protein